MAEASLKSERDAERQRVMAALAAAPTRALAQIWDAWADKPETQRVRGPETGLVMVRGRTGGGGSPFNLGEATVTRATVRLSTGEIGHSYALGRDGEKAVVAATLDALWQTGARQRVMDAVVALEQAALDADEQRRAETAATRVNFFTMVRGED
ncbi:phosphonate C-P lyase system protein PhnG [Paradevosia shaoguanensis]|uniref:phosphonate C-P lyase system protein PhnG n=2 Tax=Paradevosia shaoguanensis TaxID=1335043 RepID=UPI00362FFC4C